ncbi:MAG: TetR/AcrR family transcriptional regulator [Bacteroidales bacterium]|nr:TetR/AcrR family transcriptional regulator [Bacteroidales bacterium]
MEQFVKNKKYLQLLDAAHELFFKHGFRRVSIDEICQKAGVSKMTFYRFFPNKFELAKTIFRNITEEGKINFKNLLMSEITPPEKMKRILLLKSDGTKNVSKEFMSDFYLGAQTELKIFVEKQSEDMWQAMQADWKQAQEQGFFRKDINPEFILSASRKLMELFNDEKIIEMYDTPQDFIMELANFFAYGISPHE